MPKVVNIILSDEEHALHKANKGKLSWKAYLLDKQ